MAWPRGVWVAVGFAVVVVGCVLATVVPRQHAALRLVVLAAVVGCLAAFVGDAVVAMVTGGMAWPFYVGFLDGRYGELHWDGAWGLVELVVLVGTALLAAGIGRLRRRGSRVVDYRRRPPERAPYELLDVEVPGRSR